MTCFIFLFLIFLKSHGFIEDKNPSEKVFIIAEELNCVDIDDIGNLDHLPWFVFINNECGNLKVVSDGGELSRNINQKRKSDVSQPVDVNSVTNADQSIS